MAVFNAIWKLFIFSVLANRVVCIHIIGVPNVGLSHGFVFLKIGCELVKRGYRYSLLVPAAIVSDLQPKDSCPGLQVTPFESSFTKENLERIMMKQSIGEMDIQEGLALWIGVCNDTLRSELFSRSLKDVDFMLCDISCLCCALLADFLGIQRVDISPTGFADPFLSMIHNFPASLAHVPQMPYWLPQQLSFISRIENLILYGFGYFVYNLYVTGPYTQLWKKYVPNSKFKSLEELFRSTGLLLIPTDFALTRPRTVAAHVKIIGPILPQPPKPLPQEFKDIISSSMYSDVIIVSFGTVVSVFEDSFIDTLSSALSGVPALVLWKHKGRMPLNQSENVKIFPWLPQNDFLGYPATKLFVTHGGLNSVYEASFHGVPMVVIPLFADQFDNALSVENTGIGEKLNSKEITVEQVRENVHKVLFDASYRNKAKQIASQIMYPGRQIAMSKGKTHSQPLIRTPTEQAADWIEYGLQTNAGLHLRSEDDNLSFVQVHLLDVILFLLVCVFVFLKIAFMVAHWAVRRCWSFQSNKEKQQ